MPSLSQRLAEQYQSKFGRPANANDPAYASFVKTALPQTIAADEAAYERSKARHGLMKKVAWGAMAIPFTAGLSSILGAGAGGTAAAQGAAYPGAGMFGAPAVAGASGAGATAAGATAGALGRMSSILNSRGFEGLTNAGLSLFGMNRTNKANDQARRDTLAAQAKALELEERRLAQEAQNANLDREDARALNAAIQELEGKKFALQQEQAQFERGEYERERGVKDEYRNTFQLPAARRMASILGLR